MNILEHVLANLDITHVRVIQHDPGKVSDGISCASQHAIVTADGNAGLVGRDGAEQQDLSKESHILKDKLIIEN